jgi:hypothetical protein
MRLCKEAINLAGDKTNPRILSHALLASAEVALNVPDAATALKNALQAQERFARWGQQESLWRAWLAAARASKLTSNAPAAPPPCFPVWSRNGTPRPTGAI